jgi:hypothetical protein
MYCKSQYEEEMKQHSLNYKFLIEHTDEFNQKWVRCPVCKDIKKADGVLKHITSMAKTDEDYERWLKEHEKTDN